MNSINFNDAVSYRYCTEVSFSQSLLQFADAYLNLNGRTAVVIPGVIRDGSQETIIVQETPSFIVTALKISSYIVTLGTLPIVMILLKDCLRSIHKFHVTNMTQQESTQRLQTLEIENGYRVALVGQCRRLQAVMYNDRNQVSQLLNHIPGPQREHFVTQGLLLTQGMDYYNSACRMDLLEVLADVPHAEREGYVIQGSRLTRMFNEYSRDRPLRALQNIPHDQREVFVTQALRVFELEVGNAFWGTILDVVTNIPYRELEGRVTRAANQLARDFPPGGARNRYTIHSRLTELLETAIAAPIPPYDRGIAAGDLIILNDDGRINIQNLLAGFAIQAVGAVPAGINVHAAGRDERTSAAIVLLRNATGAMSPRQIDQANTDFLAYLRRQPASPARDRAERAFIGPGEPGACYGPLQPDNTFTIHGFAIPGREVIARLWHFCNTYTDRAPGVNIEAEREYARQGMVTALTHSYDEFGMVCNPGKVQRLVVAVLQGRLAGVDIDRVVVPVAVGAGAPPAMTAQRAKAAFWADARHQQMGNRAALRIAANRFIDQNPNMEAFRADLQTDVDTFARNQELPNE